ncbi:DUF58 domain-containing protein [Spirochaetota bacterium]
MSLYQKSQLLSNISAFKLDSRIGRAVLSVVGTGKTMGEWVSPKPGHSPVILDYRYYRPGDPVKDIDWKLSARTEKVFIKIREGFRQTDFLIAIDGSGSMKTTYTDSGTSKFIGALTLAYIIGKFALRSRDRIFILWEGEKIRVDNEQVLIDTLVHIEFQPPGVDESFWQGSIAASNLFVLSDFFIQPEKSRDYISRLAHDAENMFVLIIQDKNERSFNFSGRYEFIDPESNKKLLAESKDIKAEYIDLYKKHFSEISKQCKSYGIRIGKAMSTEDPLNAFIKAVS